MRLTVDDGLHALVAEVRLDGEVQMGVQEIDLSAKTVVRGKRLAPGGTLGPRQFATKKSGYIFDLDAEDFILETVQGETLQIVWKDRAFAARFMRLHCGFDLDAYETGAQL